MNETQSIPVACELPADEQKRCADAYRSGLFSHVNEVHECSEGYSLRFSWTPDRLRELGEFLAVDSSCCSFLDHSVEVPRGKQTIWLHLTGPEEVRDLLTNEIELLLPRERRPSRGVPRARSGRLRWGTLGASGVGLVAVLCCVAPAFGVAALATVGAWRVDSSLALGLVVGVGLLSWGYSRRRGRQRAKCCR